MNQRIGYVRVFAESQLLDLQREALMRANCAMLYEETVVRKNDQRTELTQCIQVLQPGDTLVVWRLDRLACYLQDLLGIIEGLWARGIHFESLTEQINTNTVYGEQQFRVFAALAECERNLVREQTQRSLATGRARGTNGGRPTKLNEKQILTIQSLLRDPAIRVAEVARDYGVSRTTIYKHCGVITPQHN